ncbi:MAG: thymidine phosphorylase, partial [Nanoarchaeota archaeon]
SIISKKLAAGSKYLLIDIPYGPGAKVSQFEAKKLKSKFLKVTNYFNINTRIMLTDGSQPIGNGIGPVLEMLDILRVLKRDSPPKDLENKSVFLAGEILELVGKAKKGKGKIIALEVLNSKKALKKFEEIISVQGKKKGQLKLSKYSHLIKSNKEGYVQAIDNKKINHLAKLLGCPIDKGSGIFLHKHKKDKVIKKEPIVTLYSESRGKLNESIKYFHSANPFVIK